MPEGTGPTPYLHAATRLEDGRPSLLIDIPFVSHFVRPNRGPENGPVLGSTNGPPRSMFVRMYSHMMLM